MEQTGRFEEVGVAPCAPSGEDRQVWQEAQRTGTEVALSAPAGEQPFALPLGLTLGRGALGLSAALLRRFRLG